MMIVDYSICGVFGSNQSKNDFKWKMEWIWRGDYTSATKQEYEHHTKDQL